MKKKVFIGIVLVLFSYLLLFILNSRDYANYEIPTMRIDLKDVDIETINNGAKDIKYSHNRVRIYDSKLKFDSEVTIKGRGHYTWNLAKKPYQLIFDEKVSILGLPKVKKYVLLANMADASSLRNDFTYSIAKDLKLNYSFTGVFVDLFIDDNSLGTYYITPKVEIDEHVVDLKDKKAIMMELDNSYYQEEEYFCSDTLNDHLTIKDTARDDYQEEYSVFQDKYNEMEEIILDGDYQRLQEVADVDSLVKYYIISEFAEYSDSIRSSLYFHMDGLNDKIHLGPVWDFDIAYGLQEAYFDITKMPIKEHDFSNEEGISTLFYYLNQIPEFQERTKQIWNESARDVYRKNIKSLDTKIKYLTKSGTHNNAIWSIKPYKESTTMFKKWVNERFKYFDSYMKENQ